MHIHFPGRAAGLGAARRHRRGDPRPPGRDRRRRDRLGEDHPAAEDLPRARARGAASTAAMIGHTQPRRIAARSVAERIAEELGTELGDVVGYQVRFTDRTSSGRRVKVMTDGILLAELQRDRRPAPLRHARSSTRPTSAASTSTSCSATSSGCCRAGPTSRWSSPRRRSTRSGSPRHFADARRDARRRSSRSPAAPTRSRSATGRWSSCPTDDEEGEPSSATRPRRSSTPSTSCSREGAGRRPGLPARRAGDPRHRRRPGQATRPGHASGFEIVPLFSRLSAAEQHRVFARHTATPRRARHQRRRDVADRARASGTSSTPASPGSAATPSRTKVQRLPIEPISQASAQPALGPLRPVEAGIAIRLYSEEDFEAPAGVHRAGDPAHQPGQRDPADDARSASATSPGSRSSSRRTARSVARRRPAARGARARSTARAGGRPGSPASAAGSRGCRSTRGWAG